MEETRKSSVPFLSVPERQSPIAIVLILFRFVRIIFRQAWPLAVVFLVNPSRLSDSWWTIGFAALGGVSAILSIVSYFKFYYYIKNEELVIERGLFQKKKLNVPFDRIQTINFSQNLIHRFFNVVSLEIDTAGSSGKEFTISALSKDKAERIRNYLLSQKRELLESDSTIIGSEKVVDATAEDELLLHLSIGDLLKVGLGQNHIRSVGIIMGTLYGWLQFAEDLIGKKQYQEYQTTYYDLIVQSVVSIVVFILIVAFIITLISTTMKYYDLRFYKTHQGFKLQTGLFNRKENSANINKIQFIRWTTNPLKSIFKLFNIQLLQAASNSVSVKQSMLIPGCYVHHIEAVRSVYFPKSDEQSTQHRVHFRIMIRSMISFGFIPTAIYLFTRSEIGLSQGIYSLSWLVIAGILSYIQYRKWTYEVNANGILIKKGLFGTSYTLLKWYKIQSIALRASIFQKRRGLTDFYLYTAAGTVRIPYIEEEKALELKNYVLYKIEDSVQSWM